jgi:hypothetical protein
VKGAFLVYSGDWVVTAEAVPLGAQPAYARAEILRQRVLRLSRKRS